jgi:hypothetical protein
MRDGKSAPKNDKDDSSKKVSDSALPAHAGKLAEHNPVNEQNKPETKNQTVAKLKGYVRNICAFPGKYWKSLERAEVSNKTIAVATVVIAIATALTYWEVHSGSAQTDKIIVADQRMATAMENVVGQAKKCSAPL